MVAGGIAVNLYGIERATGDIDLILDMKENNLQKFIKAAKKLKLKPKIPVEMEDFLDPKKRENWIKKKGMKVFSLYDPENAFFLLDILIEIPFDFDKTYRRRKIVKFEDTSISVTPIKELIAMKQKADRPQDKADVYYLKKIKEVWNEKT
jgi:hypothetical protein